ncbi:FHA domain-containing protein [Streptomyces sp. ISL-98]|uniref:FtsK/SpoIIIE domain-containing protein n=1 Tax=Streptomyces sp. ISL-98 TaxID=2819192 RepID=UPI001BEB742D|nr:FtsK/SpoIIIE domain-containing protein [Streptomyces sp. ISL-98]MBT2508202.1 FHA domain-containing protein [Streptomyces sp. ISL-98]
MQIRLTVLAPRSGQSTHAVRDVLVTAPAGTALAAVASGLAAAVSGPGSGPETTGAVVVYAGRERLDAQRCALGEPPLVDGTVLSLHAPAPDGEAPTALTALTETTPAQLHVVAGPDAGGVHLLHGGQVRIGRSTDADVPLDDPDVSRLHCAVTLAEDGRVSVEDLGSTNGTALDGKEVTARPVRLTPGALLRVGESALRLAPGNHPATLPVTPDGEGHLRVTRTPDETTGSATPEAPIPGPHHAGTGPYGPPHGAAPAPGTGTTAGSPAGATYGPSHGGHGTPAPGTGTGTPPQGSVAGSGHQGAAYVDGGVLAPAPAAPSAYGPPHGGADVPAPGTGSVRGSSTPGGRRVSGRPPAGAAPSSASQSAAAGDRSGPYPHGGQARATPAAGGTYGEQAGTSPASPPSDAYGPGGHPGAASAPYSHEQTASHQTGAHSASGAHIGQAGPRPIGPQGSAGFGDGAYGPGNSPNRPDQGSAHSGPVPAGSDVTHAHAAYGSDGTATAGAHPGDAPAAGRGREMYSEAPRRRGGIGAWARRLAGGRTETVDEYAPAEATPVGMPPAHGVDTVPSATSTTAALPEAWPDPASILLTALGPGPRLWERAPGHPEALVLRLGTADRAAPDGGRPLPAVPVTVGLREVGSLGLAGPRARLAGLARSAVAQLAALHSPTDLEIVLISTDRSRAVEERTAEWAWLGWLPHLRPAHGQDCRLLLAYDKDQAAARVAELVRRTDEEPQGSGAEGPYTVVIVDGDPGSTALRDATARLAATGAASGIHLVCLAETPAASPLSPVAETYEAACAVSAPFRECGAAALLSGDVATALRLLRTAGGQPAGHGTLGAVDAVSAAWAERFGRALAPLRADGPPSGRPGRAAALPASARLLDELGLARATPASLMARWAAAADDGQAPGATRAWAVLGAGPRGPLCVDLTAEGPHLLIEGPAGSGRTELLRSVAASLAAAARPDRIGLVLVDGAGGGRGDGLRACTELPHVSTHLVASDPVRMREFAQALGAELKRRHELLGSLGFAEWHTNREISGRLINQRPPSAAEQRGDLDPAPSGTLRLRTTTARAQQARPDTGPSPLPRLVVLVDDLDALVAPALGSTGRPTAGSVVRALEAVARDGERLGVHLVATSARPDRTADTELARGTRLRVTLDAPPSAPIPDEPAAGRGRLRHADGSATPFQGGRVTGRIPRTATLRPTVVPLEWERMGDPPTRRPVRELGNGPTDLALLASALDRAARTVNASPLPPLGTPVTPSSEA